MQWKYLLGFACLGFGTLTTVPAMAETVGGNYRGFSAVHKGVKEIGVDSLFLLRVNSTPLPAPPDTTATETNVVFVGGLTPRYFVANNLSLALNLDYFYRQDETKVETKLSDGSTDSQADTFSDSGFLGVAMVHYYVRLGNSMFFKPGIGGGGFVGTRSRPVEGQPGQTSNTSLSGAAGRADLGFAFYTSQNFNLKAGLDAIVRIGSEKPEEDANGQAESQSFTTIDAGFNVGFAYSF